MALGGGPDARLPPPPEVLAFKKLIAARSKRPLTESQQNFVKNIDSIPLVALPMEET